MFLEKPPEFFRRLFKGAEFRVKDQGRKVYLTFDDGPIPEITPWVLDILDEYGIKATFFMVGENAERHPELLEEVVKRGHHLGNHTYHHLQGIKVGLRGYLRDVKKADRIIGSKLFRPPHGLLRRSQLRALKKEFRIIMYDLVTRDYSRHLTSDDVVRNVKKYARNGSIIVFHDSIKSFSRLEKALPESIEWLKKEGYEFGVL